MSLELLICCELHIQKGAEITQCSSIFAVSREKLVYKHIGNIVICHAAIVVVIRLFTDSSYFIAQKRFRMCVRVYDAIERGENGDLAITNWK